MNPAPDAGPGFDAYAENYDESLNRALAEQKGRDRIKRMMAVLEPLSILVIGGMIGLIVIALFTAIASINNVPL